MSKPILSAAQAHELTEQSTLQQDKRKYIDNYIKSNIHNKVINAAKQGKYSIHIYTFDYQERGRIANALREYGYQAEIVYDYGPPSIYISWYDIN